MKPYTRIDEIVYQGNELAFSQYQYTILSITVYDFANTGIQFCQYWYTIPPIPVYNLQYQYTSLSISLYDFVNSSIRIRQYRRRYFFKDLGKFEVKIKDSKNMGALEICLDRGSRMKKKNRFCYKSVPERNAL